MPPSLHATQRLRRRVVSVHAPPRPRLARSLVRYLAALAGDRAGRPYRADPAIVVRHRLERGRGHRLSGPAYHRLRPAWVLAVGKRRLDLFPRAAGVPAELDQGGAAR